MRKKNKNEFLVTARNAPRWWPGNHVVLPLKTHGQFNKVIVSIEYVAWSKEHKRWEYALNGWMGHHAEDELQRITYQPIGGPVAYEAMPAAQIPPPVV